MNKEDLFKDVDKEAVREAVIAAQEAQAKRIASIDIEKHYRDALRYLDNERAFFLTDVLNMGKPEWDLRIPTAAVYLPPDKKSLKDFKFIINPTFAALLEVDEFAFILAHETMHIRLNHLKVLPAMVKKGAVHKKANIAADCLINDWLNDQGLCVTERLRKNMCLGEDWTGYDCSRSTCRQIYLDLDMDKYEQQQADSDALSQYLKDLDLPATGGHGWIYEQEASQGVAEDMGNKTPQNIQNMKDNEDQKPKKNMSAGAASNEEMVSRFQNNHKVSLNWIKLLQKVHPDFLKLGGPDVSPSFARIPRKMTYIYEKYPHLGRLPTREILTPKSGEHPTIVMFLDGSGSCSDWIDKFVSLAKSVPQDQITLMPYTFSTHVEPLNINEEHPKVAAGGTEFSCIEEYIQKNVVPKLGKYPNAIVTLSDGEGQFQRIRPKPQDHSRWLWLIKTYDDGTRYDWPDRGGEDVLVKDFMKGMPGV